MKRTETLVDQKSAGTTMHNLINPVKEKNNSKNKQVDRATHKGKTEYPNTQTDCQKLKLAPNNAAFIVITAAPAHITTKTIANNVPPCLGLSIANSIAKNNPINNGPHKSQSLNW
mmetsp:Transcript_1214/g.1504  ORF Transcript_1214/g.1504 Transcript_1214/m.1504 type:complete len:115 (-) Transcript_1214:393-737(-)